MSDQIELLRYPESLDWGGEIDASEYLALAEQSCERIWSYVVRKT